MHKQTTDMSNIDIRDAFFDVLYNIASNDNDVMFLTADMGAFSLERFKNDLRYQYINVGVAEQNLVNIATGLVLEGKNVFIYGITPFVTMRCYEQIKVNVSGMCLPIKIIGSGPGITYSNDGPTHHAIQDISIMRALPNMIIFNPSDPTMASAMANISYESKNPVYIRIDKGKLPILYPKNYNFSDGLCQLKKGYDLLIITTGIMVHQAFKLVDKLAKHFIDTGIIDLYRIKPINEKLLLSYIDQSKKLIILEEHSMIGGIGSIVCEILSDNGRSIPLKRFAIGDKNCNICGDREWMWKFYNLDIDSIIKEILNWQINFHKNLESKNKNIENTYSELVLEDFAHIFGTTVDNISDECKKLIENTNFRFNTATDKEREQIFLDILKTINSGSLSISGPDRKDAWEIGWSENLNNFENSDYTFDELIPKFFKSRHATRSIRLYNNYIIPEVEDFEINLLTILRMYLFQKYFHDIKTVYEFGSGTGLNLVALSRLFPEMTLYGLDWSMASCKIIDKIAEKYNIKMSGILFDMFSPDYDLNIASDSAIFTLGTLEQLGNSYENFIQFLLNKSPNICINIETIYELYDQNNLFDYIGTMYLEKRGYLKGYLSRLKELERKRKIEILEIQRTFGGFYHDGYSFIVWRPINENISK